MFIYGVLPGIIICFFYATIKALTQRTPEGIVDIIYILCTLIIFPVAYGYFIYRRINAKKDKKCEIRKIELEREQNKSYFIKDLCEFERSYDYKCIYVDFISTDFGVKNISKLRFIATNYVSQDYVFYEHGYADIDRHKVIDVLQELEKRLDGYLKIDYHPVEAYSSSMPAYYKVEHGIGGDFISPVGDYDYSVSQFPSRAWLYLGDEAKRVRQADRDADARKKALKRF